MYNYLNGKLNAVTYLETVLSKVAVETRTFTFNTDNWEKNL